MQIEAERVLLRPWRQNDLDVFAAMLADPEVMVDMPVASRNDAERKLKRYSGAYDRLGFCRWAMERRDGVFLGYVGVMPVFPGHPRDPGFEIGWRLTRDAWGHGYVTEGATAALRDMFRRTEVPEVLSYTAPDNRRSQAVMARLGLERSPDLDFISSELEGAWAGLVWRARPEMFPG